MGVGHMVHEEEQLIGTGGEGFVLSCELGRILAYVSGAGGGGAIHADAIVVGSNPLTPTVAFSALDAGAEGDPEDQSETADPERAGVVFVCLPAFQLKTVDGADHLRLVSPGHA